MTAYSHTVRPYSEQGDSIEIAIDHDRITVAIHRAHTTEAIRLDFAAAGELLDTLAAALRHLIQPATTGDQP